MPPSPILFPTPRTHKRDLPIRIEKLLA